jgi:PAS domain S-box-containing protein
VILDAEHTILAANHAIIETTGKSAEQLRGLKYYEVFHHPDMEGAPDGCPLHNMLASGELETVEMEMEALGGTYLVSCTPVLAEAGHLKKIIHIATDITDRKHAEEALRQEKEKAQRYFDIAGVMLMVLNVDGTVEHINERGCEILGYSTEDVVGKNWFETFLPDSCYEQLWRGFCDFVSGKIPRQEDMRVSGNENPVVCSGCRERIMLWNSSTIFDGDGKTIVGVLSSGEDITERKQAEEQLQHYVSELGRVNAELSQYAYVVSHDLKAPLRAIHNYADFLREDLEDSLEDEQRTYLDHLQIAVVEADTLVNDILELSRIGRQEGQNVSLDLGEFFASLLTSLHFSDDVVVTVQEHWPVISTQPPLLRQVFQNLLSNAVKFNTSSSKRVELGWRSDSSGSLEIFVRDNGIGIDPQYADAIFGVFRRLHTKTEFDGTGVGLAIVKKAVSKLGGAVWVESEAGQGSTFWVKLPRSIPKNQS